MLRFPRFLNAVETHLLNSTDDPTALHALIHQPPSTVVVAPRAAPSGRESRRRRHPRRAISRERAQQLARDDDQFRYEMGDTS